jgi:hypothetical protein
MRCIGLTREDDVAQCAPFPSPRLPHFRLVRPSGAMVALAESRDLLYITAGAHLKQRATLEIWDWRPRGIMAITDAWRNIPPHGEMLPIVGI